MVAATFAIVTVDALARFNPVMVTWVPFGPVVGVKLVMVGGMSTVNELALVPIPVTVVTLIWPLTAPGGTVALICPSLTTVKLAAVPANFTEDAPVSPVPLMVMLAPTTPEVGLKPVTAGAGPTVNGVALVPVPVTAVTEICPVVAPEGTVVVIEVSFHVPTVAGVPLKLTEPGVPLKVVPVIVTAVPAGPPCGLKLVTKGAGPTTKLVPLAAVPVAVATEIGPVDAPAGTATVIDVSLQTAPGAAVLLKFTMLEP